MCIGKGARICLVANRVGRWIDGLCRSLRDSVPKTGNWGFYPNVRNICRLCRHLFCAASGLPFERRRSTYLSSPISVHFSIRSAAEDLWLVASNGTNLHPFSCIRSLIQAKNQKCRVNTMYALSNVTFRILRIKEQYSGYVE